MNKQDVQHLAKLARIELTEAELEAFTKEMSAILAYVGKVKELVSEEQSTSPTVGDRYNIFRSDQVTNEPDFHSNELLAEMPKTQDRYLVVKKILQIE